MRHDGLRPENSVGPCPATIGCTAKRYSSISPSCSSAAESAGLPTSRPHGVRRLSAAMASRRSPSTRKVLLQGKSRRVVETTCLGLASSLRAQARNAGRAFGSRATAGQALSIIS